MLRLDVITGVFSRVGREDVDLRSAVDDALLERLRLYLKSAASLALKEDASGELKANLGSVLSLTRAHKAPAFSRSLHALCGGAPEDKFRRVR